jgi:hypothetical protein
MSEQDRVQDKGGSEAITGSVTPSGEIPFSEVRKGLQLVSTSEPQTTPQPEASASQQDGGEPAPPNFED